MILSIFTPVRQKGFSFEMEEGFKYHDSMSDTWVQ